MKKVLDESGFYACYGEKDKWKDGLPPVGAIVLAERSTSEWVEAEVLKQPLVVGGPIPCQAISAGNALFYAWNYKPIKSEADKLRDEQIEKMRQLAYYDKPHQTGGESEALQRARLATLYDRGCRMTRELTDDVVNELWESADAKDPLHEFAQAIAAYVRGDSATGE